MTSKTFEIKYSDPFTEELKTTFVEFSDTGSTRAEEWAEDYAYALADKGYYKIREVPND